MRGLRCVYCEKCVALVLNFGLGEVSGIGFF